MEEFVDVVSYLIEVVQRSEEDGGIWNLKIGNTTLKIV